MKLALQIKKQFRIVFASLAVVGVMFMPLGTTLIGTSTAYAIGPNTGCSGPAVTCGTPVKAAPSCAQHTDQKNSIIDNCITNDLRDIINFLAAGVAITVIGSLVYAGIMYTTAGDNPQMVQAAKKRITRSILALLTFFFMYAFLQFLVPGGLFG